MPSGNHVSQKSAEIVFRAEKRLKIAVDYNGNCYQQEVVADSVKNCFRKARAAIASRNFDAAFHGTYSIVD